MRAYYPVKNASLQSIQEPDKAEALGAGLRAAQPEPAGPLESEGWSAGRTAETGEAIQSYCLDRGGEGAARLAPGRASGGDESSGGREAHWWRHNDIRRGAL